jgi:hypothetical protein
MKRTTSTSCGFTGFAGLLMLTISMGCRSEYGGHRPTAEEIMNGSVQYYAPGPEFKLANEAATMKAAEEEAKTSAQANSAAEANTKNTQQ